MALTPLEFEALLLVAKRHKVAAFEVVPTPAGPGLKVSFNPLAFLPEDAQASRPPPPAAKKAAEKKAAEEADELLFHSSAP